MFEFILGFFYGLGICAMYFGINDLAEENKLHVTGWDKVKLILASLAWPYAILYFSFYVLSDYVRVRLQ